MDLDKLEIKIVSNTEEATAGINKQEAALNSLKKTMNGMKTPKIKPEVDTTDLDKAAQKVSKLEVLLNSLKRIAFYRAIRSAIREVTQAIKEGIENAYEYSKIVGGDLAPALDRIASAGQKLKNQLGAAFGELITALEPVITWLLNALTEIALFITKDLAMINALVRGENTYLVADDVSKSWKEADKAAKAYKKTLLGIDEINRLNDPNSGGKTPTDYGSMFHEETLPFSLKDINFDWLKGIPNELGKARQAAVEFVKQLETVKAYSPLTVSVGFRVLSPVGTVARIVKDLLATVDPLLATFPVELGFKVGNPVPEMVTVTSGIETQTERINHAFETVSVKAAEAFASAVNVLRDFDLKYQTVQANAEAYGRAIDASLDRYIQIGTARISTFMEETVQSIDEWGPHLLTSVTLAFMSLASGVFPGITLAKSRVSQFFDDVDMNFNTWGEAATEYFGKVWTYVSNTIQNIKSAIDNLKSSTVWQALFGNGARNGIQTGIPTLPVIPVAPIPVPIFANGGYVDSGELFVARENGPELVGNIGGRTGVANNGQIIEGISEGVRDANTEVVTAIVSGVSQIISAIQQGGGNGGSIDIDMLASALYNPMKRQDSIHGASLVQYTR